MSAWRVVVTDCRNLRVTGLAFDSGYAEAMLIPATPSPPFPAG